jgi:hypothetical protein
MNIRRLIGGLSFLFFLVGALLVCLVPGGLLNPWDGGSWQPRAAGRWPGITFDQPGHIFGFVLLSIGAIGFVVLFSLNKPRPVVPKHPWLAQEETSLPHEPEGPGSPHIRR